MGRPSKPEGEKPKRWSVLSVIETQRKEIKATATATGFKINADLIACTNQTRLVRRIDQEHRVRHLAPIDAHLEQIARKVAGSSLPIGDAACLLLALHRVEILVQNYDPGGQDPGGEDDDAPDVDMPDDGAPDDDAGADNRPC